ncbi:MAG: cytochrome P450 [Deltaproteobacteria bacterium]|jgi:cytochrome P450|nr:cytochrome P450 [Deltaproteobacteria bacterium]MBW2499834.1 cytochrome P450 [Deltaproteobacteria bacterium]
MPIEYDPFSEDVIHGDNHAIYKRLRDESPVHFLEKWNAFALSRFEDVWWACEGDFVSSARGATSAHLLTKVQPVLPLLNNMDPPEHTKLRGGLRKHFMPARVRALEPWIRERVRELLEPFADGGTHEFVEGFAQPLAMSVGCKVIGLPEEDADYLRDVVGRFFQRVPGQAGMTEDGLAAMGEMNAYLRQVSVDQRAQPPAEPNAISVLRDYRDAEGRALDDEAIGSHLSLLLIGGTDTLPKVLANLMLRLQQNPDQRAELAASPDLAVPAFNEAVRIDMPTQNMCRLLTRDVERQGVQMQAGQPIVLLYTAANRDEREFPDPERFEMHRNPPRSLGFSHGTHACIGLHVARKEGEVAIQEILSRFPEYEVDTSGLEKYATEFVQGYSAMPIRWHS